MGTIPRLELIDEPWKFRAYSALCGARLSRVGLLGQFPVALELDRYLETVMSRLDSDLSVPEELKRFLYGYHVDDVGRVEYFQGASVALSTWSISSVDDIPSEARLVMFNSFNAWTSLDAFCDGPNPPGIRGARLSREIDFQQRDIEVIAIVNPSETELWGSLLRGAWENGGVVADDLRGFAHDRGWHV
ncbi:hypothetical protein [Catenulispora pinisilvae]|uniref:hypothetical protein n=1 Tax=Catenulispora pinisilvae TaxID=2705253 RepID=UPI0018912FF4|nr:hypothetical protein [Catenulispora pinisilvae]